MFYGQTSESRAWDQPVPPPGNVECGKQGLFNNTSAKKAKDKFAVPEDIGTHHIFQAKTVIILVSIGTTLVTTTYEARR